MQELITLKEAAAFIGKSYSMIRKHVWRGNIKATKRGAQWFVTKSDVQNYYTSFGIKKEES